MYYTESEHSEEADLEVMHDTDGKILMNPCHLQNQQFHHKSRGTICNHLVRKVMNVATCNLNQWVMDF